jgi:hypothetical protein
VRIRTGTIAAAVLGLIAGAILLFRPPAPDDHAVPIDRGEKTSRVEPDVAPSPDEPVGDASDPDPVGPVGETPAADATRNAVLLSVEVLHDDGRPAKKNIAYAWPAGRSGDSSKVAARANTDEKGRAVLELPASGTYDVGCVDWRTHAHAMTTDVVVPTGVVIRLILPPTAFVDIVPAPDLDLDGPLDLDLEVAGLYGLETRSLPGRGQRLSTTSSLVLNAGGGPVRRELVAGVPFRLAAPGIVTNPDPFVAPVRVIVAPSSELYKLEVFVRVALPPGASVTDPSAASLRLVDGEPVDAGLVILGATRDGRRLIGSTRIRVPRPTGVVELLGRVGERIVEARSRFSGLKLDEVNRIAIVLD